MICKNNFNQAKLPLRTVNEATDHWQAWLHAN